DHRRSDRAVPGVPRPSKGCVGVRREKPRRARSRELMRVLFDNGTPRGVAAALKDHVVDEARARGWDALRNSELLDAADAAGFDVFLTTDRNIRHQLNLAGRRIAVVVLSKGRWRLIKQKLPDIAAAVAAATPGSLTEVEIPID